MITHKIMRKMMTKMQIMQLMSSRKVLIQTMRKNYPQLTVYQKEARIQIKALMILILLVRKLKVFSFKISLNLTEISMLTIFSKD